MKLLKFLVFKSFLLKCCLWSLSIVGFNLYAQVNCPDINEPNNTFTTAHFLCGTNSFSSFLVDQNDVDILKIHTPVDINSYESRFFSDDSVIFSWHDYTGKSLRDSLIVFGYTNYFNLDLTPKTDYFIKVQVISRNKKTNCLNYGFIFKPKEIKYQSYESITKLNFVNPLFKGELLKIEFINNYVGPVRVVICDLNGNILQKHSLIKDTATFSSSFPSNFESGTYLIKIFSEMFEITEKLIIV